jgi:hypothetical protein
MKTRITLAALAAALSLLLAMAGAAGAYDQTLIPYQPGDPLTNGCPSGFEALQDSVLIPYGYQFPTFGDVNGDGIVCGKPWTSQEMAARLPNHVVPIIFEFEDNWLPSVGR